MNSHKHLPTTETLLRLVADPRRRTILRCLRENDGEEVDTGELLEAVAAAETGTSPEHVSVDSPLRLEFRHTHAPMLADAGLIAYDADRGTARYVADDRVDALLQFVSEGLEPDS